MEESKLLPSVCHTRQSTSFLVLPEAFWSSRCVRARCCCGGEWLCIWCMTDQSSSLKNVYPLTAMTDWSPAGELHMSECNNNALIAFHICGEYLFNVCAFKRFSDFISFNLESSSYFVGLFALFVRDRGRDRKRWNRTLRARLKAGLPTLAPTPLSCRILSCINVIKNSKIAKHYLKFSLF